MNNEHGYEVITADASYRYMGEDLTRCREIAEIFAQFVRDEYNEEVEIILRGYRNCSKETISCQKDGMQSLSH